MNHIIVAHDRNRAIGFNNSLPWAGKMRDDMRHFKKLTTGNAVIMGRVTYDSIGRPLPDRKNIVLSGQKDLLIPGCSVVHTIEEAFQVANEEEDTYVIGGAKIYQLSMPYVDSLHITLIDTEIAEGDAFFVDIDLSEWKLDFEETHNADHENMYAYTFKHYLRKP